MFLVSKTPTLSAARVHALRRCCQVVLWPKNLVQAIGSWYVLIVFQHGRQNVVQCWVKARQATASNNDVESCLSVGIHFCPYICLSALALLYLACQTISRRLSFEKAAVAVLNSARENPLVAMPLVLLFNYFFFTSQALARSVVSCQFGGVDS